MNESILELSKTIRDIAGREVRILKDASAIETADRFECSVRSVYEAALNAGICPFRYIRNRESVSMEEQLQLVKSRVAVVGSGGLGGPVLLVLARMGIGSLVVVDHDRFDETNLNRQALSSMPDLGQPKSGVAARVIENINPGVDVRVHQKRLDARNADELLAGSNVIVDALDNVPDRFSLQAAARALKIPLVHGAVAGFEGQLMTIFPEDTGFSLLYGTGGLEKDPEKRPEALLGVPAVTPSLVATLQAMEVIKILLGRGNPFRNVMVHVDMEAGEMNRFSFE
ncbi:MAG: HesA/MoeB/ThiF family protein [Deltaproteobacteria bacterium]|nr:HesA/MoeB/ThiF family protein [Deltaproteobacteria bacterium]